MTNCGLFARGGAHDRFRPHIVCDLNGRRDRDGRPLDDRDFVSLRQAKIKAHWHQ
jgi:hypothetical protein